MVLAVMMTVSCMTVFAQASEADAENGWLGDGMTLNIEPGKEPYVYAIAQDPDNNRWYYETSNHTVKKEVTGGGAIHIFPIVDSTKLEDGVWTPDDIYNCGTSNYDVMYCCDSITGTDNAIYYKRVNLEDSEYVTNEQAKKLRAIVTNAYPYVSVDEAKAALKAAGFAQADELDRSELITATQAAVWSIANKDAGDSYRYNKTATTAHKLTWGGYMHEFANEIANFTDSTVSRKYYSNPNGTGDRINALIDFYLAMEGVEATREQIVITKLDITGAIPSVESDDLYSVFLKVELNNSGSSDNDKLKLDVYVDGQLADSKDIISSNTEYEINVNAKAGDSINAVVSGTQYLSKSVYFYVPEPQDIDGDGIATSREVSQNLIGVASGETAVRAEDEVKLVVSSVTGAVTLHKVDENKQALAGAEFDLYKEIDGEKIFVESVVIGESGALHIGNMQPGTYELVETKAPEGFHKLENPIRFNVKEDGIVDLLTEGDAEVTVGSTVTKTETVTEDVEAGEELPKLVLNLIPGEESSDEVCVTVENETFYREAVGSASDVEVKENSTHGTMTSLMPEKNTAAGTELDMQYWKDPSTVTVTGEAPAGYPYQKGGAGQQSNQYISRIYVIYEKDENGECVIKELRKLTNKANEILTVNGEPTLDIYAPFDQKTGTTAAQAFLKDAAGNTAYVYCCDLGKDVPDNSWYSINNLEDVDYFASEDAENHIRNIVLNGYWGTASGTGSLAALKEKLVAAFKAGEIGNTVEITYKNVNNVNVTETVTITEEILNGLTEAEALDMTQTAIWAYSNGTLAVQDGRDGYIVGNITYGDSARGHKVHTTTDDKAGMARMTVLHNWLINLDEEKTSTTIINEHKFVENMKLEIGNKVKDAGNDVYLADLSFDLEFAPGAADDLLIHLSYVDAKGETKEIVKRIAGTNTDGRVYDDIAVRDGRYVIEGLELSENTETKFDLRIEGVQTLENGVYLYIAQNGIENVQTLVGVAEGTRVADVTKTISFTFNVDEKKDVEIEYAQVSQTLSVVNKAIYAPTVSGVKTWNDEDDRDGIRPESITINLLANGKVIDSKVVTEADGWAWTFENLYKYENGEEIVYSIEEVAVDGYETAVDGYNVTNTYVPEKTTVSGTKTWVDEDNADGIRPESITIGLLANGEKIDSKVVTEADGWAWTFENLYKYENGEEIEYTVTEDAVEGYETVVDGYNVTNTHEVEEEIIPDDKKEDEEIDDPQVPLAPADKEPEKKPEVKPEAPEKEELVEIEEEEIPLAPEFTAPQTGDASSLIVWLAAAVVTGTLFIIATAKMRRASAER